MAGGAQLGRAETANRDRHASLPGEAPAAATPAWRRWLQGWGFAIDPEPSESPLGAHQAALLKALRWLFGLIWLYDTWTVSSSSTRHALAAFLGLPFSSAWVHLAGTGILLLSLFVALALLSGKGMRVALWIGLAYLLFLWAVVEHGGDFDPAAGGTDLGLAPPYMVLLLFVWAAWRATSGASRAADRDTGLYWMRAAQALFGFIWAWDALYKLRPYFLGHFLSYLVGTAGMPGQPAWVQTWLHGWIAVIGATSPLAFAIIAALIEVVVAWSLLRGRWLRFALPLGFVFSLLIWSTAEGFGGPYGNGTTGMPGNLFGTAIIYALIFLGLMAFHRWPRIRRT